MHKHPKAGQNTLQVLHVHELRNTIRGRGERGLEKGSVMPGRRAKVIESLQRRGEIRISPKWCDVTYEQPLIGDSYSSITHNSK